MISIDDLAARMGFPSLADARLVELAIAAALGALALGIGWLVKRGLGTRLADWLHGQEFGAPGPLAARAAAMLGWLAALLFVGIAIAVWPWDPFALLLLDIVLAISVAVLIRNILVGVGLNDAIALTGAFVALVVMLSRAVGGLAMLQERLDSVGLSVGARHFSLLSAINILLTVIILFTIVRVANRVLRRMIKGSDKFDPTQRLLIEKIAGVVIIVAAFFVGIDLLGIDLTAFAVFSGALGLAIGFGLQKTVGNLIAGIILLMDRSIKPGDVIVVGDSFGWVNKIGVRAVSVITREGKEHLIPNEILMTQEVENWSYSSRTVRVKIAVGVAYDTDLRLAQTLMIEAAKESKRVLEEPVPVCWITGFGDSSVDHEVRFWITDPEAGIGNIKGDVFLRIWDKFHAAGIEIPYPQRDLRVRDWPDAAAKPVKPKG
ncbi:mechanosensitive ion channel domain-containing protein [Sphingopyxis sp. 2PD]|uniref:mechanosensitive ion channel family protein n=1 Tax=Sphingopyxis sp. 2PD TaxID=2502196 RepID=UPI0010F88FD0|nr:mechanosensitive ion channel domain-containing protein [Sphingopyxis sp. 2PD]